MKRQILVVLVLGCVGLMCVAGQTTAPINTSATSGPTMPTGATTHALITIPPATNITKETVRPTVVHTTKASVVVPRYEVKNSDGKTCILMEFIFDLLITFKTKEGESGEAKIENTKLGVIDTTGNCTGSNRTALLTVANYKEWQFRFEFEKKEKGETFDLKRAVVRWKYEVPFFQTDVDKYGEIEHVELKDLDIHATTGKTFKCDSRSQKEGPVTFTMTNIRIQPYAQESSDKGNFGEEETCSSSLSTGAIIGIIAGVLVLVIVVVGVIVYFCRNQKKAEYTSV